MFAAAMGIAGVFEILRPSASIANFQELTHPADRDTYAVAGFDLLSGFTFQVPEVSCDDPRGLQILQSNEIPESVRSLDNQKVVIQGYMFPLKSSERRVKEFLILRDHSWCCYGEIPEINEWIIVKSETGFKPLLDVPINFYGKLRVGEKFDENRFLVGVYQMDCDAIGPPYFNNSDYNRPVY